MAHSHSVVHGVFQAYKDISWESRDDDYFHPPYSLHDRRHSTPAHDEFKESCKKRYSSMLDDFCGYSCYVVWVHEKRLFCDHNRSCCLSCGEVWVRFDAPDDHSTHNGLTVCGENTKCTREPLPKVADVLNEYRLCNQLGERFWIGLTDSVLEGRFLTVHGQEMVYDPFNTTSFYGANNYNNEDCACVMYYPWHGVDDTITNDVDCSTELIALCQKHESGCSPGACHRRASCYPTGDSYQCVCGDGFVGDGQSCTVDNRRYFYDADNTYTNAQSKSYCENNGGWLAYPNNQAEWDIILQLYEHIGNTFWLGVDDKVNEGVYLTVHGQTMPFDVFNTTGSYYGANNYNNQDCVVVSYYTYYNVDKVIGNDVGCGTNEVALCQRAVTTTTTTDATTSTTAIPSTTTMVISTTETSTSTTKPTTTMYTTTELSTTELTSTEQTTQQPTTTQATTTEHTTTTETSTSTTKPTTTMYTTTELPTTELTSTEQTTQQPTTTQATTTEHTTTTETSTSTTKPTTTMYTTTELPTTELTSTEQTTQQPTTTQETTTEHTTTKQTTSEPTSSSEQTTTEWTTTQPTTTDLTPGTTSTEFKVSTSTTLTVPTVITTAPAKSTLQTTSYMPDMTATEQTTSISMTDYTSPNSQTTKNDPDMFSTQTTSAFLPWTTLSLDEILSDLGLEAANESDIGEMTSAMNDKLDGNVTVPPATLLQFASALYQATSLDPADESSSHADGALQTCSKIVDAARGASAIDLYKIATAVVGVGGNVLTGSVEAGSVNKTDSNSTDETENFVRDTLYVLDKIATVIVGALSANDKPMEIITEALGMSVALTDQAGEVLDAGFATVVLESNTTTALPLQVLSYAGDPFESFSTNQDGFISGASPVGMKVLDNTNQSVSYKAASKANTTIPSSSYNVSLEETTITNYLIDDLDSFTKITLTLPGDYDVYTIRCEMEQEPSVDNHSIEIIVTDSVNVTKNEYNSSIRYDNSTGSLEIFVHGRNIGEVGYFYVSLDVRDISSTGGQRKRRSTGSGFSAGAIAYKPRIWNETAKAWMPSSDVQIDPDSTGEEVIFKSNFMGSMTSGLVIPPNKIDFDDVFDNLGAATKENPYVLIVVCLIAGLYFLLLIPVVRMDRRDQTMWEFLPILHNRAGDGFMYQISIAINNKSSTDFDTEVFCVLYGVKGKTTSKTLCDGKQKNFRPGYPTNHTVTCQEDIGSITHIHVWTQPRDERDSLLIDYITVTDLQLNKSFTFLCNDWISSTKTLCYCHEIFKADVEEGKDFVSLLKSNAKERIYDDHLWISVVKRSKKSNFTRVQRWSLCIATLYLTMVVNAMWFPTGDSAESSETSNVTMKVGPIELSWRTIYVSFMGAIIVVPPAILITFFFRRSRTFIPSSKNRKVKHNLHSDIPSSSDRGEVRAMSQTVGYTRTPPDPPRSDSQNGNHVKQLQTFKHNEKKYLTESVHPHFPLPELRALERKNNTPFTLPWWGVVFGYILCGVCIANGVWWPYLYSIQWGKELALQWLASLVFSLFQSIIVIQPIKVLLVAVLMSVLLQDNTADSDDINTIKKVSDLHGSLRPVESIEPPIKPQRITNKSPLVVQSEARLHKRLWDKLRGVFTHLMYLALLIWIVGHNTDRKYYLQNLAIKDILELNDMEFSRIEDIWPWMRETILPRIYPENHYNGDPLNGYDRQFVYMTDGLRMGPIRLKQNRDEESECNVNGAAEASRAFRVYECVASEETRNWNAKWNGTYNDGVTYPPYIHEVIKGRKYSADIDSYKLGGYTVTIYEYWYDAIDLMESEIWVDKQTRAVFIELVVANMNVNIFTQIKIVMELPVYGGVLASYDVSSFRPYPFVDWRDLLFLCVYALWGLVRLYIIISETRALWRQGWIQYMQDPWHIVEWLSLFLAIISIVCFAVRCLVVIDTVEFMKNNKHEYVDFDAVMRWDTAYSLLMASVLFIAILQLLKPMDFSQQLTALKATLKVAGGTIIAFSLAMFIVLVLYSHVMTVTFGSQFEAFTGFTKSFYYLFGMLLSIVKYSDLIEDDTWLLRLIFAVYMVAGNFFLLNLFISVINEYLAYMSAHPEEAEFDAELSDFLVLKLESWWISLTGGRDKERRYLVKVRRGGPWNRELELYYGLLRDDLVTPIEEKQAIQYQENIDYKAEQAADWVVQVMSDRLSSREKATIPVCKTYGRDEHTIRLAIRTIIMDMVLSNNKVSHFIESQKEESAGFTDSDNVGSLDDEVCLTISGGRIGPAGGRLEVLPNTWIVIDTGTFEEPTYVSVQAFTTSVFASHIIQLQSQRPLAKPFKCCLPFKDGKRRDYCNVFVQRDDGPWMLTHNSVTCLSEYLRCWCCPHGQELQYRIAAKALPQRSVAKVGAKLNVLNALLGNKSKTSTTGLKTLQRKWGQIPRMRKS